MAIPFVATGCSDNNGTFYTLQQAYDEGLLTKEDLQTIADYHNEGIEYPEQLSESDTKAITKAWTNKLRDDGTNPSAKADNRYLIRYYGIYNSCMVVILDDGLNYWTVIYEYSIEIDGILFIFRNAAYINQIYVWER